MPPPVKFTSAEEWFFFVTGFLLGFGVAALFFLIDH
jgi:hypothetical protein